MGTLKLWLHSEWKQNQKILNPKQNKTEEKPNQKTPQPTKNQTNTKQQPLKTATSSPPQYGKKFKYLLHTTSS